MSLRGSAREAKGRSHGHAGGARGEKKKLQWKVQWSVVVWVCGGRWVARMRMAPILGSPHPTFPTKPRAPAVNQNV